MAERSVINGNIAAQLPTTGTINVGNQLGDYGFHATTTGGSTSTATAEVFDGSDCIKISISGAGGGYFSLFGNINQYSGNPVNATAIPFFLNTNAGDSVTITAEVYIESITNMTVGASLLTYNHSLARTVPSGASTTTKVGQWVTLTHTITTLNPYLHYRVSSGQITSTPGSVVFYIRNISVINNKPARTTATNRVAVRDMGTALSFDGSGDYINCGDIGDPLLGSLSVSGFFKANTGKGGRLVGKRDAITATEQGYDLTLNTNGTFRTYVGDGTVGNDTNNISASHNTGIWKHFAYVIDRGKNLKILYINGVAISSVSIAAVTGSIKYAGDLFIGATRTGVPTNVFTGFIDEPRIWNRALTPTEIQNLYYNNIVPQDGLVAEYLFNEGSGSTAIDTSGNGNNGTISGATYTADVPLKPRVAVRDMGTALRFDGVDDEVTTPIDSTKFDPTQPFTITFELMDIPFVTTSLGVAGMWLASAGQRNFGISIGSTRRVIFTMRNASDVGVDSTANVSVRRSMRNFVAVRFNGTHMQVYVNGSWNTETAITPAAAGAQAILIGRANVSSNPFYKGRIDNFRVFQKALFDAEVDNLNFMNIVPQDGLVAEYLFDEGAGTTALDTSGNGNDGTITGATYTTDTPLQPRTSV